MHCAEEYHILCSLALICDQSCLRSEEERNSVEISKIGIFYLFITVPTIVSFYLAKFSAKDRFVKQFSDVTLLPVH